MLPTLLQVSGRCCQLCYRCHEDDVFLTRVPTTYYPSFQDLIKDLESELSGDFRETIMGLFKPTSFYDAWSLHQATSVRCISVICLTVLGRGVRNRIVCISKIIKDKYLCFIT